MQRPAKIVENDIANDLSKQLIVVFDLWSHDRVY